MFGSSTGGSGFGGFGQQNNQQTGQSGGLFGQSQPAQTNTPSFGGFGSAQPQQMPAFGSSTTNTGGGGLFGQTQQQPSSGFSFGQNTTTPTQPFGQTAQNNQPKPAGFGGFGASTTGTSSGFGGFGANQTQQPAFGSSTSGANTFGAKPAGGLFGQQPQQAGAFGQPPATGGLFGGGGNNISAQQTGGMPTQGTSNPPYQAFVNSEKDANGTSSTNYQYNTITCLPAYRAASVEELRVQDYQQGRKSGNAGPSTGGFGQPAATNAFGGGNTGGSLFGGQAQQSTGGFGASTTGGGLFGQNNQQPQQQSGGLFGSTNTNTNNTTGGGLFGQPAQQQAGGGGLFGQSSQQQQGSTGFTFGQSQPANNAGSSGFTFGQNNQQQNKPGGLFGGGSTAGFGSTTTQPASSGFSFGGNNAAQQPQAGGFGGAASSGGFGFGAPATANQSKPGGLFGATTTAPTFGGFGATTSTATDANKPAFSFGGGAGGFGSTSAAPGQTTTAAPTGGLFGNQQSTTTQPSTGFSFGAAGANNNQGGLGGGTNSSFSFGGTQPQQQQGNATTGFGSNTSLFGQNKPATGGLFGSTQPQQQQAGTFSFGGTNNATSGQSAGGGLFGAGAKPATGGLFGSTTAGAAQAGQGGGLFGSSTLGGGQQASGANGGLFGSGQNTSGGLFGNSQSTNAAPGGGGLFGASSTLGGGTSFGGAQSTGSLFGQSQMNQSVGSNLQTSLNANPFGTDALFGGAAASLTGSLSSNHDGRAGLSNSQAMLPFNVAKPSIKKQPPLVPPFRPSPRASTRITKLRGSTPGSGFRESTPVREGTPSLFASANATSRPIISSPSASSHLFRGLSDDVARSQREASVPTSLPSQAFVGRSSVKRLVLDDQTNKSVNASNLQGRSRSLFGGLRGSSAAPEQNGTSQSHSLFDRSTSVAASPRPISFSPALETAAISRSRPANGNITSDLGDDSTFGQSRSIGGFADSPSKGVDKAYDESLPSLHSGTKIAKSSKVNKEDALLPLDYYTVPSLSELREWSHAELRSVESFVVGRKGFGSVEFVEPVDLTTVGELNNIPGGIVQLRKKECFVYPDEEDCFDPETGNERDGVQPGFDPKSVPGGGKASRGEGLNVPALVNLEGCWPLDRSNRQPIKDIEHPRVKQMVNKLRRRTDLEFKNYEPVSGTWTFKVEHFSRYGIDGEDEDEEKDGGNQKNKGNGPKGKTTDDTAGPMEKEKQEKDDDEEMVNVTKDRFSRVSRSATPNVQQSTSKTDSQPWAATLGLEARRMQVMQASFFGGSTEKPNEVSSSAKGIKGKVGRPASQSVEPQRNNLGSRSTFGTPMRVDIQPSKETFSEKPTGKTVQEPPQSINIELAPPLTVRPRKFTKLALEKSVADDGHEVILDAGLAMGRSFRVGWGPHGTFVHRSKVIDTRSNNANVSQSESLSVVKMGKLQIFKPGEERGESETMIEMLKVQLENSIIESEADTLVQDEEEEGSLHCPIAYPNPDLRFKHFLISSSATTDQDALQKRFESAIFRLGSALFDEIDIKLSQDADESLKMHALRMRRKHSLSEWIRWYVEHSIRAEIRTQIASPDRQSGEKIIFSLLSGGFFEEACKQALEMGDVRLSTLLAQVNGGGNDDEFRLDLLDQLSIWRAAGADSFISTEYRKIFEVLSGNVLIGKGNGKRSESGERVEDIGISAGLDWVRTFALFLHYDAHFEDKVDDSILSYESCIGKGLNDHLIVPPLPPYLEKDVKVGSKQLRDLVREPRSYPNDILFGLLKIYSQSDFPLEGVLDPHQYGSSPLNFGIAFHVSQLLSRVLGVRDFGDRIDLGVEGEAIAKEYNWRGNSAAHDNLCIHFAMQLESMNFWTWAAFVLLHLEMPQSRKANIVSLLSRNVDRFGQLGKDVLQTGERAQAEIETSDDVKFITEKLQIPVEWIYEALASAAANNKDRFMQFKLLLRARLFSKAHSIAVIFLAPEGIIRHDFTLIMELFTPFRKSAIISSKNIHDGFEEEENQQDGGDQIDISGWQAGGQTFLDYIAICRSLPWLVGTHAANVVNAMESIYPDERNEEVDLREALQAISSSFGSEIAEAVRKIDKIASRIPNLLQRIDDLFDNFIGAKGDHTTIMVARKQMIQSVHNCIRSLKATRILARLANFIPSLNVDLSLMADQETRLASSEAAPSSQIEIENLHFMANAYCSAMVEINA